MANIKNQNEYTLVSGTSGDDTIYNGFRKNRVTIDAGAGNDSIYNDGYRATIDGGTGSITLLNATPIQSNIDGSAILQLTNDDAAKVTIGSDVAFVDATERTAAIEIKGNELDNSIVGGRGSDKFYGGAGADTFIYVKGDDKDVITDFGDDDLLQSTFNINGNDYHISGVKLVK